MKVLDIYIARAILGGVLIALFALTALDMFFALIGELDEVGKGDYQLFDAFLYLMFTLPRRIYDYFPAAVLVGSLLSLGAMAGNSELIAMRAAGVSVGRIVRATLQTALLLMLTIATVGEFWVPPSEQYAQQLRYQKQTQKIALNDESGVWVKDKSFFINIDTVFPDRQLKDVTIYELDEMQRLRKMTTARSAIRMYDHWQLLEVQERIFEKEGVSLRRLNTLKRYDLANSNLLGSLNVEPVNMSARDLYAYVEYLQANKLDSSRYQLAFWLKLMMPLSGVVMLLLALPFVFGFLRSVNTGQLMLVGILLGLSFYIVTRMAANIGQIYNLPPFVSTTFPILLMAVASLLALKKVR